MARVFQDGHGASPMGFTGGRWGMPGPLAPRCAGGMAALGGASRALVAKVGPSWDESQALGVESAGATTSGAAFEISSTRQYGSVTSVSRPKLVAVTLTLSLPSSATTGGSKSSTGPLGIRTTRSEQRRVGKEWFGPVSFRWSPSHL